MGCNDRGLPGSAGADDDAPEHGAKGIRQRGRNRRAAGRRFRIVRAESLECSVPRWLNGADAILERRMGSQRAQKGMGEGAAKK